LISKEWDKQDFNSRKHVFQKSFDTIRFGASFVCKKLEELIYYGKYNREIQGKFEFLVLMNDFLLNEFEAAVRFLVILFNLRKK
jgi:hypothetical protein